MKARVIVAHHLSARQSRAVIGTTGGWRDADLMNAAVSQGRIDMCGIARPLALEPGLAKEVLSGTRRDFHL